MFYNTDTKFVHYVFAVDIDQKIGKHSA